MSRTREDGPARLTQPNFPSALCLRTVMEFDLNVLRDVFGDYESPQRSEDWERVKTTVAVGAEVTGKVLVRVKFGVFLDIGVGFPALIRVPDLKDADVKPYTSLDMYPAPGSNISGVVLWFDDGNRQVDLSQRAAPMLSC